MGTGTKMDNLSLIKEIIKLKEKKLQYEKDLLIVQYLTDFTDLSEEVKQFPREVWENFLRIELDSIDFRESQFKNKLDVNIEKR